MKIKRLLKALIQPRVKDPLGPYINSITTIQELINKDLLYIDVKKPHVVLSLEMHLIYMDNQVKLTKFPYSWLNRMGLIEHDRAYCSLFNYLRGYINFHRGILKLPKLLPEDRLNFLVMNMEKTSPLLVGYHESNILEYNSMGEGRDD